MTAPALVEVPVLVAAIVSAGRPGNVGPMNAAAAGLRPVWLVPSADVAAYRAAGAMRVQGVPGGLVGARNRALDLAAQAGGWSVQLDDDLRGVKEYDLDAKTARPVTLRYAVGQIIASMLASGARLGGAAPTANAYFTRRALTDWGFILGSLAVVVPGPERYDPALPLKEDWDMTCQHLDRYGLVARRDDLLADWRHYSAHGGCTRYRTPAGEAQACALLLARWPQLLRAHARRENELALRLRTGVPHTT